MVNSAIPPLHETARLTEASLAVMQQRSHMCHVVKADHLAACHREVLAWESLFTKYLFQPLP
jgi:hypothetical protein